jgi:hypothetical protein
MLHPEIEKQELILYTSRAGLGAFVFLSAALLTFGCIAIFHTQWSIAAFLLITFMFGMSVFVGPVMIWKVLRTPLLIIDDEGIASPRLLKNEKIKWEEINAIYGRIGGSLLIDASPSGLVAFLTRRNKGRLVIPRAMDITIPQTVLVISQSLLPIPLDRLLEQIRTRFQDQLERSNIELARS